MRNPHWKRARWPPAFHQPPHEWSGHVEYLQGDSRRYGQAVSLLLAHLPPEGLHRWASLPPHIRITSDFLGRNLIGSGTMPTKPGHLTRRLRTHRIDLAASSVLLEDTLIKRKALSGDVRVLASAVLKGGLETGEKRYFPNGLGRSRLPGCGSPTLRPACLHRIHVNQENASSQTVHSGVRVGHLRQPLNGQRESRREFERSRRSNRRVVFGCGLDALRTELSWAAGPPAPDENGLRWSPPCA